MIALFLALTSAQATNWGEPKPYVFPRLSLGYTIVNGEAYGQVLGGGELGVTIRDRDKPHWLSLSRVSATGIYGLTTGSIGGDFRVGSFIGPDGKVFRILSGPDVWYNGYGDPNAADYFQAWAPGIDLRNTALLKVAKEFQILGEVTPGWVFVAERQTAIDQLVLFHELKMGAYAFLTTNAITVTIGYTRRINSVGTVDSIVIGAGI
jgi:hypothetical protein